MGPEPKGLTPGYSLGLLHISPNSAGTPMTTVATADSSPNRSIPWYLWAAAFASRGSESGKQ